MPEAEAFPARRRTLLLAALATASLLLFVCGFALRSSGPGVAVRKTPSFTPIVAAADPLAAPAREGSPERAAELDEVARLGAGRTKEQTEEATYWQEGAVLRWNEIAQKLVARHSTNPVVASRLYALLSVAQHDALVAAIASQRAFRRLAPPQADARVEPLFSAEVDATYPSDHAAVAAASAAIIAFVYPARAEVAEVAERASAHEVSRILAGVSARSDIEAGDRLGRAIAAHIIEGAKTDGANRAGVNWRGDIPVGRDKWVSAEHPPTTPLRPLWSQVRPWLLKRGDEVRPEPPPSIDSPAFVTALDEVRRLSRTRTPEQTQIAERWADAQGTPTPPGHWNEIAAGLIRKHFTSEVEAARVFAFLNMAMMDAGIACWDAKYTFWLLRPTQADPTISIPVGLPNFPSYPSGHSSFSGAAGPVLAHFFPAEAAELTAMATEASMSRVYGGIHYRFDGEAGLTLGGRVAALAIERERARP